MSQPAIRRLRHAIAEKRKKIKKSKGIFSTMGKKESREVAKILLPVAENRDLSPNSFPNTSASLIGIDEVRSICQLVGFIISCIRNHVHLASAIKCRGKARF